LPLPGRHRREETLAGQFFAYLGHFIENSFHVGGEYLGHGFAVAVSPSPKEVESRNGRRRGARAKTLNECALSLRGEPVHREAKYTSTGISVVMG